MMEFLLSMTEVFSSDLSISNISVVTWMSLSLRCRGEEGEEVGQEWGSRWEGEPSGGDEGGRALPDEEWRGRRGRRGSRPADDGDFTAGDRQRHQRHLVSGELTATRVDGEDTIRGHVIAGRSLPGRRIGIFIIQSSSFGCSR